MKNTKENTYPTTPSLKRGTEIIAGIVKTLSSSPGVYRMVDDGGNLLYVGKAKTSNVE